MFKDTQDELNRLEAELWAEEDEDLPEDQWDQETEELDEEDYEDDYEEYDDPEEDRTSRIYANTYEAPVRNFANGYRAYNTDRCDEDLDEYSEAVEKEPANRGILGLAVTAMVLLTGILGILVYWLVLQRRM